MSATLEKKQEILPVSAPAKRTLTATLASKFDMEPSMFLETIKKTVMPSSASNEEIAAFLMVAREYDLNPILREIHAFPKKGGGIQTVVGVDGWAKIITRNQDYDGMDFNSEEDENGHIISITCTIYRKSCSRPTVATEYYSECKRNTEPWNTMPRRMLRHKAMIQCGRIAFGLAGVMDEDEAHDICEVDAKVIDDPLKPGRHETRKRGKSSQIQEALERTVDEAAYAAEQKRKLAESQTTPDYYTFLHRNFEQYENIIEKFLSDEGLPPFPQIKPAEMSPEDLELLKLVAKRVAEEIGK